jgi:sarcosine oxidase, subunit beta
MSQLAADVVVIGGGITGAATAYALARDGVDVVLVERFHLAAMASGWTLAGVRQSGRHPAELPLARAAVDRWAGLDEELDAPTGYRRHGNMRLARTPDEVLVIRRLVEEQRAQGLALDHLPTTEAVREREPALAPTVLAASFCPTDGSADPIASVEAFARAAERHGARLLLAERVTGIEVAKGRVEAVRTDRRRIATAQAVIACGAFGNELLAPLGLAVPLHQPMVTVLQTEPMPPLLGPVLGVANADMAGRQEGSGRLRVTSGAGDWHGQLTTEPAPRVSPAAGSVAQVVEKLTHVLPAFATCAVHAVWAGLLDLTPDALPVLDRVPGTDGLVAAMGFSGHGFGIGPVTGEIMANLVQDRPSGFDLTPFRFARFNTSGAPQAALTLHG